MFNCDQALPAPDRRIDIAAHRHFGGLVLELPSGPISDGIPTPAYSTSLDAVLDLTARVLPGWCVRVLTSSESDDVWLEPDSTHPEFGAEHLARWPNEADWLEYGPGLDASFDPSPRAAMALLAVLIEVHDAISTDRAPDLSVPAARQLFKDALTLKSPKPAA